jgi:hypothetical protein
MKKLLNNDELEKSFIVANCRMNRERVAFGINSYEKEADINPVDFLEKCIAKGKTASWLDMCCGNGKAILQAEDEFKKKILSAQYQFSVWILSACSIR